MRLLTIIITFVFSFKAHTQIVPNVSVDSLTTRMFPIYLDALRSGSYDLPRDTSWEDLKSYEAPFISIGIPKNWLVLGALGNIVELAFDASGLYFPEEFNKRPILAGVFVLNWRGNSLEEVKNLVIKDNRTNPDRVYDVNYKDSVYNYTLEDGTKAYIFHTRFFRKSKQLNQSRYELILFSDKYKKGYSVMISVQYFDPTYKFEADNSLKVFAARIFSLVKFK